MAELVLIRNLEVSANVPQVGMDPSVRKILMNVPHPHVKTMVSVLMELINLTVTVRKQDTQVRCVKDKTKWRPWMTKIIDLKIDFVILTDILILHGF